MPIPAVAVNIQQRENAYEHGTGNAQDGNEDRARENEMHDKENAGCRAVRFQKVHDAAELKAGKGAGHFFYVSFNHRLPSGKTQSQKEQEEQKKRDRQDPKDSNQSFTPFRARLRVRYLFYRKNEMMANFFEESIDTEIGREYSNTMMLALK